MLQFLSIQDILLTIPIGSGYPMSYIEAVATVFGLFCIWFASLEKTINYPCGLINVTLFAIIFYQIQLYGNLLLQIFFFFANIYGWYAWSCETPSHEHELKIRWLSKAKLLATTILGLVLIIILALYIDQFFMFLTAAAVTVLNWFGLKVAMPIISPDAYPLLDSAITVLSIIAMILMTRKYIENWLLWIVIDVLSVILYAKQGVYAMALEYVLLLLIVINGARMWVKLSHKTK